MKRKLTRKYRVDLERSDLQQFCDALGAAQGCAEKMSRLSQTTAQVIQLIPTYAVLDTYRNGVKID
jgi:hypothetical protein